MIAALAPTLLGSFEFEKVRDVSQCIDPKTGQTSPCQPGNQVCPPGYFDNTTPQFHVKDASCGENDPNGPSYDPVHGVCISAAARTTAAQTRDHI
jgi:hypothetical protein